MYNKPLHHQPFTVPQGVVFSPSPLLMDHLYHTPGEVAAIRFFDPHAEEDFMAMREIIEHDEVKKWMDDAVRMSKSEYREWAGDTSDEAFLFAVLHARADSPEELRHVHGFIYIYSEEEEKIRVRRMEKMGLMEPATSKRYCLEVSFARRQINDRSEPIAGLISSALRQSCLQVKMLLGEARQADVEVFAFVDPSNTAAQRTLEACGFVYKGAMKYDRDSREQTLLYLLDWSILQEKINHKILAV